MGATAVLAEFISSARERPLPDSIALATRHVMLDSIGCALGGHSLEAGRLAVAYAERQPGNATIIGSARKVTREAAIFANGQLMNVLDLEECMMNWGHEIPFVLPVALTVGEELGASGEEVVRAVAIGFEVGVRISAALAGPVRAVGRAPDLKMEPAGLFGYSSNIFGGAAAAAVLMKLTPEQIEHTFGIASFLAPVPNAGGFAAGPHIPMSKYGLMGATAESA